jgi:hypothetical protein
MNYGKFLTDEIKKAAAKKKAEGEPVAALVKVGGSDNPAEGRSVRSTETPNQDFNPSFKAIVNRINSGQGEGVSDLSPEARNTILRGLTYLSRPQPEEDIKTIRNDPDYEAAKRWLVHYAGMPQKYYFTDDILRTGWNITPVPQ